MRNLDEVLAAIGAAPEKGVFVSRSGAEPQPELALWIAARLQANGYIPIVQDAHFKHADFMLAMERTLASGARVLALLSREYLASQHCRKEWTAALDNQENSTGRLVLLNIDDCRPMGLLRYVDRVRFGPVWRSGDVAAMEQVVLAALAAPADLAAEYRVPAAMDPLQTVHPEVLDHNEDTFTGRDDDLARLRDLLWNGGTAALTRAGAEGLVDEAALAGMGGIGKTTLARAYAFRQRRDYHGVWWVRAERRETLVDDLIALGRRVFDPGLDRRDDREAAAREVLTLMARERTNQPWLVVYDNAPGPGALTGWRPAGNAHVIVTSRNPAWDAAVPLAPMRPEAAVDFLCATARRNRPEDRAEAAALAADLGYLPLALAHAASKCHVASNRRLGFAAYGGRLAEFWDSRPDARSPQGRYPRSVYATFTLALDEIVAGGVDGAPPPCPEAETVLGVLAHLEAQQIPEFMLVPLWQGDGAPMAEAALDRALEGLAAAGLVTWGEFEDGAPHLGVHRLVQEIMRARLAAAGRADEIAVLATRAVRFGFDWESGAVEGAVRNGRWLAHAERVLDFAPPAIGDGGSFAVWIALFVGDHRLSRGSTVAALESYRRAQAIAERLAASDAGNAGWQRDLSVSHDKIGDVQVAQGNLPEALRLYRASLAIFERLAKADPGNAGWQRNLSVSYGNIGDVQVAQGKLPEALTSYRASLAIRDRLAASDAGNAVWQRDLAISNERIGDMLAREGDAIGAIAAFERALAAYRQLIARQPDDIQSRVLSVVPLWRLGGLKGREGRGDLEAALAILKPLADADRLDARRKGWTAAIEAQIAGLGAAAEAPVATSAQASSTAARPWWRRFLGG